MRCEMCNKEMSKLSLNNHIFVAHKIKSKDYYDIYLKKDNEGICYCGRKTNYVSFNYGYREFCSVNCQTRSDKIEKRLCDFVMPNYECNICHSKMTTINGLSKHVWLKHQLKSKDYYDTYFKKDNEGICYCGRPTNYLGMNHGYNRFCGNSCGTKNEDVITKTENTTYRKYGFTNYSRTDRGRLISRETYLTRIAIQKKCGYSEIPAIGKYEKQCLDVLQSMTDYYIFRNKKLYGYFPDGYIKELNLIIEFDEPVHYANNQLKEKDVIRENVLKKKLNCSFLRIKEKDWLRNKDDTVSLFRKLLNK